MQLINVFQVSIPIMVNPPFLFWFPPLSLTFAAVFASLLARLYSVQTYFFFPGILNLLLQRIFHSSWVSVIVAFPQAPFWVLLWFAFVAFWWVNIRPPPTLYWHILSDGTQLLLIMEKSWMLCIVFCMTFNYGDLHILKNMELQEEWSAIN